MKIKILGIKPAVSKADKVYYKVETNNGNMTAFDKEIVEKLQIAQDKGQYINLDIVHTEKDGRTYTNIRAILPIDAVDEPDYTVVEQREIDKAFPGTAYKQPKKSNGRKEFDKDPVGLAVEVFNALVSHHKDITQSFTDALMNEAIALVKQAQEAFR